ncbi:MAG: dicarboxylate/amino acid:cation symporter [Acidobacteria bacterium]|nr:dicarboxylate/amino acid:cation symporter [Acidobacteriota bacterium]
MTTTTLAAKAKDTAGSTHSVSLGIQVVIALVVGLAIGVAISASGSPALQQGVEWIELVGTLWVNAIRMTVIPLVTCVLIVGVNSTTAARVVGRVGARALLLFLLMLSVAAIVTALVAPPLIDRVPVDQDASARLRASAARPELPEGAPPPTFRSWVSGLIPSNLFKAAADGAILPVVIAALLFALAVARTSPEIRGALVHLFQGFADALFVLIRWVLALAPVGVFALTVGFSSRLGVGVAGALTAYLLILPGLLLAFTLLLYPVVWLGGGIPIRRFARACAPAQIVAFSSRSSLASLPALIEGATERLKAPPVVSGFLIPFAVSIFRLNIPVAWTVGILFIAHLYGIALTAPQLATIVVTSVMMSFSAPGIPSGSLFFMAPLVTSLGIPAEGVGLLIAVDTIPDIFKTTFNVTADMAAAAILSRRVDV